MPASIKDLETRIAQLFQALEKLSEKLDSKCEKVGDELEERVDEKVRGAVLEQEHEVRKSIDQTIDSRFKTTWLFAGGVMTILSAVGYLGVQTMVTKTVEDKVGREAVSELETLKSQARASLVEIEKAKAVARGNPLIVLQTDFGSKSPYMGALMGAIYKVNPYARIQVNTCEIDPFDVTHAAWSIWRGGRHYPSGTIFVVITNPGGITRPLVVMKTKNGHTYIGFDNGCFDFVAEYHGHLKTYTIASKELTPTESKDLFGGIDVCGPTAGKLSLGFDYDQIGPVRSDYQPKLTDVEHRLDVTGHSVTGTVMDIDGFGNVITNVLQDDLEKIGIRLGRTLVINIAGKEDHIPLRKTYGDVPPEQSVAIIHDELLQFAINEGNFKDKFSVKRGSTFEIKR
jgi:S-adenosylmethionine hydrolase